MRDIPAGGICGQVMGDGQLVAQQWGDSVFCFGVDNSGLGVTRFAKV